MLCGALTGCWHLDQWYEKLEGIDFFDVKGILNTLFDHLNTGKWYVINALHPSFHPGRCAEILVNNEIVGIFGEIHPETQRAFELSERVQVFEINLDKLFSHVEAVTHFEEIPRFPGILLDVALVVDEDMRTSELEKVIEEKGGKLLRSVDLFDVYRGEQLEEGKKSVAFSLCFRADDRTLDLDEIKKIYDRIIAKLVELGAEPRSQ